MFKKILMCLTLVFFNVNAANQGASATKGTKTTTTKTTVERKAYASSVSTAGSPIFRAGDIKFYAGVDLGFLSPMGAKVANIAAVYEEVDKTVVAGQQTSQYPENPISSYVLSLMKVKNTIRLVPGVNLGFKYYFDSKTYVGLGAKFAFVAKKFVFKGRFEDLVADDDEEKADTYKGMFLADHPSVSIEPLRTISVYERNYGSNYKLKERSLIQIMLNAGYMVSRDIAIGAEIGLCLVNFKLTGIPTQDFTDFLDAKILAKSRTAIGFSVGINGEYFINNFFSTMVYVNYIDARKKMKFGDDLKMKNKLCGINFGVNFRYNF